MSRCEWFTVALEWKNWNISIGLIHLYHYDAMTSFINDFKTFGDQFSEKNLKRKKDNKNGFHSINYTIVIYLYALHYLITIGIRF